MTTTIRERMLGEADVQAPQLKVTVGHTKLFAAVAIFAMAVGGFSFIGGLFGAIYTYNQAAVQNITTPEDAAIANAPVRGPLTLWSQSDIITTHQLDRTGGLYYAEMDREVPAVDEAGNPILDENGEPVMVENEARASWLTATTLTSALGLGILSYAVSAFAIVVGLTLLLLGWTVLRFRNAPVTVS
jgi:hypothetical protein